MMCLDVKTNYTTAVMSHSRYKLVKVHEVTLRELQKLFYIFTDKWRRTQLRKAWSWLSRFCCSLEVDSNNSTPRPPPPSRKELLVFCNFNQLTVLELNIFLMMASFVQVFRYFDIFTLRGVYIHCSNIIILALHARK